MQLQGPADEVSSSLFLCSIVLICVFSYNHNNNQGFGSCFKGAFSYSPFLTVLMDELNLINVASLETNPPFKSLFKWYKGHLLSVKVLNRQKKPGYLKSCDRVWLKSGFLCTRTFKYQLFVHVCPVTVHFRDDCSDTGGPGFVVAVLCR